MTPEKRDRFVQVVVTLERREDGGLRAYSDDVPGFVLSHRNPALVLADIVPALETILSAMFNKRVFAGPLVGIRDALDARSDDAAIDEAILPPAVECARYVARVG